MAGPTQFVGRDRSPARAADTVGDSCWQRRVDVRITPSVSRGPLNSIGRSYCAPFGDVGKAGVRARARDKRAHSMSSKRPPAGASKPIERAVVGVDELVQEVLAGVGENSGSSLIAVPPGCLVQRFRRRDGLGVPLLPPAGLAAADQQHRVAHRVEFESSALPGLSSAPPDQADEHPTRAAACGAPLLTQPSLTCPAPALSLIHI